MIHALAFVTVAATAQAQTLRAWFVQANVERTSAEFRIEYRKHDGGGDSEHSDEHTVALGDAGPLRGLPVDALFSSGSRVHFTVARDAGSLVCDGWAKDGNASGEFTVALNPAFARELERRGIGTPTAEQQERFVYQDVGYALLDALRDYGYERPSLEQLSRLANHGVTPSYLRGMHTAGFTTHSIDEIVRARDHGVDPKDVQALRATGVAGSLADFIRARDHGVDAEEARAFGALGYPHLTLEDLIRLRDHGVTADYVRRLESRGYAKLTVEDLIRLRDHGV
jgi:hypothetical protein